MTSSASGGSRREDSSQGGDPLLGRVLDGRYRIDGELGKGGVGVVYRATHMPLQRSVALKVLHDQLGAIGELRMRFEREAQVLSALQHPHIVAINDYGIADGMPYLVMELLEGRTLADLVDDDGPPDAEIALDISRQMLRGLAFAHARGVVHRDLKAANVFLVPLPDAPYHVKILDFGLAKIYANDDGEQDGARSRSIRADRTLTKNGTILGTPAYMSPEQASGSPVDERTDVYSAGVVIFELLTGRYPFLATTRADMLRAHMLQPVPRLSDARPGLEAVPELERLLDKAMAKERPARFGDAQAMLEALDALPRPAALWAPLGESGEMPKAGVAPSGDDVTVPLSSGSLEPLSRPPPTLRYRSVRRAGAWAAAVLGAALMLAGLVFLLSGSERPPEGAGEAAERAAGPTAPAPPEPQAPEAPSETSSEASWDGIPIAPHEPTTLEELIAPEGEGEAEDGEAPSITPIDRDSLPPSLDPFIEVLPRTLRRYHFKVRRGQSLTRAERRALQRLQRQTPRDARPTLILAHHFVDINFWSDALTRYALAFEIDPAARGDARMLRDLARLAATRAVGDRAADMVVRIYGPEAIAEVEVQRRRAMDPEAIDRLTQLGDRLQAR